MNACELVSHVWRDLARRQGCARPAAEAVLEELVRAYAEPHRHYHTIAHIASLLQLLDEHGGGANQDAVTLAILFHDAIYDPARRDNEAASATLATERLIGLGFPQPFVAKVESFILATQHGPGPDVTVDADLALLLDLDLSVLAAAPDQYRAYAQAIRREYALYSDELYRPGRRRVLEAFLSREIIYGTERLRTHWEARARANLAREIAELG